MIFLQKLSLKILYSVKNLDNLNQRFIKDFIEEEANFANPFFRSAKLAFKALQNHYKNPI